MPGMIPPITPAEFFHYLQRCIPPVGWSHKLAVANSGGPDSVALLFLLHATLQQRLSLKFPPPRLPAGAPPPPLGVPRELVSIHVNHDLQDAATTMQSTADRLAHQLGVSSHTAKIPWGEEPLPSLDKVDERVAREARYTTLFASMQQLQADTIAFAHHADDQVETAIMRMSQGSSSRGLAAMRPVRRWGMGKKDNPYFSFGVDGMHRWIVRPLLHVSKDRILATCEANKLDYVNDPTNFQPDLTYRNSIRQLLSNKSQDPAPQPDNQAETTEVDFKPYIKQLRDMAPGTRPADQLREAVRLYGMRLEEVETQVTDIITRARLNSPASTLLLRSDVLEEAADEEVRYALIRRCLRYCSPGPWGDLWSEAGGEREALKRISRQIWLTRRPKPEDLKVNRKTGEREDPRKTFSAGAGVIAYPVTYQLERDRVRFRASMEDSKTEVEGWYFARAPPHEKSLPPSRWEVAQDVTEGIRATLEGGKPRYTALFDNRFAIHFHTSRIPKTVKEELTKYSARVRIEPESRWILPKVMLVGARSKNRRCIGQFVWEEELWAWKESVRRPVKFQSWMTMEFVRSLDAV
ncbi:hypothetical protein BV20DRAFT_963503 [Pilatotrama ljubarskyi]|nr:hypothetical protein BV20DRAFT_963503 [Pilatotrama ljubarskyi]